MMELCEIPGDLWTGECMVKVEDLSDLLRRIWRAQNLDRTREPFLAESFKDGRVFYGGNDDEAILRRLRQLLDVVCDGIENKEPLIWG